MRQPSAIRQALFIALGAVAAAYFVAMVLFLIKTRPSAEWERAVSEVADFQELVSHVPRDADGQIQRQGDLSGSWLNRVGALPPGFSIKLSPNVVAGIDHWGRPLLIEAHGTKLQITFAGIRRSQCRAFVEAARLSFAFGDISARGDPAIPFHLAKTLRTCGTFAGILLFTLIDPAVELPRLMNVVHNLCSEGRNAEIFSGPAASEMAPITVRAECGKGLSIIQMSQLPFGVCKAMLIAGPEALGLMELRSTKLRLQAPVTAQTAERLCVRNSGEIFVRVKTSMPQSSKKP